MADEKFILDVNDQDGFRKFIEYEAATLIISLLEKGRSMRIRQVSFHS